MCKLKTAGVLVDILNIMSSSSHVDSFRNLCNKTSLKTDSDECIHKILKEWKSDLSDSDQNQQSLSDVID